MTANVFNQTNYLRTSREFPEDLRQLSIECNKSYIDIASAVNNRVVSTFPTIKPIINGENWFINNQRQQGFRQVYTFTSTASISHRLDYATIDRFTNNYGAYTDGTNWYGLIFGTSVAIAGQISFYITSTQIVFLTGAGAPALTKGNIVLSWIGQV